jgi:glycosyltransferase involved in cell wall biosynthesis
VFFIRRSFRDNHLYKAVLQRYLDYLIEKRFSLEWYLEGGRSRSGRLLPPRLGLLNYVLDKISNHQSPILLPGFIEDADKAALLSGATAVLSPSLYEGFGFPALEAQACGTAVLCANTSSLPEIVADSALTVDPLNTAQLTTAIQKITSDEALRAQLVAKGFENIKRFDWQKTAVQLLTILESTN